MPSEPVYEIKKLRWKRYSEVCYIADTVFGEIKLWQWVYEISPDRTWHIDRTVDYPHGATIDQAKAAAERWYRTQLCKALRRVSVSSTPRPRKPKKGE